MAWLWLLVAGIAETGWAIGIKYSDGFSRPVPTAITVVLMVFSFYGLAQALKVIPLGTAYAVWTGIGAMGTIIAGLFLFQETMDWIRAFCIFLILIGIVGLKWFSK